MSSIYIWAAVIFAILGFVAAVYFYGRKAGSQGVENDVLEKTTDVQKKQLDAANKAPHGKDDVLARLREKGL